MSLPGWLRPAYSADQMRAVDAYAIEDRGTPGLELMEHAGAGVAQAVQELDPKGRVCVVSGKGNNGGDGFVCARLLAERGRDVVQLLLAPTSEYSGDAEVNLDRLQGADCNVVELEGEGAIAPAISESAVVVDAVFGTGFSGESGGVTADAIAAMNECGAPVVAVDMPSGVDGSTGEIASEAVRATVTTTFHAGKVGLFVNPGKLHAGRVQVVDIGIPEPAEGEEFPVKASVGLVEKSVTGLYPKRLQDGNKFMSGSVAVIGGSTGLTGAVCMASDAAMRTGAGYVQAVVPASLNLVFENKLLEVMTVPAADSDGALARDSVETALDAAGRASASVVGPGLGRDEESLSAARELVARIDKPLLVDADGLYALVDNLDSIASRSDEAVLTPHAGELARLLGVDSAKVSERRLHFARELSNRTEAVVVLKGDDSIIVSPDGLVAISRGATPGLATAGSGDVLSGAVGALMAKRMRAFEAACLGVYLHAQAGIAAAERVGSEGMVAGDVIESLPSVLP